LAELEAMKAALPSRTLMAVSAGGGIELTIKLRLTLRIDLRNWTFFDPDEAANAQFVSTG
jgi:6-phosphogluconolactonase/glucosamine-6-phosphate isomerase/deaminase